MMRASLKATLHLRAVSLIVIVCVFICSCQVAPLSAPDLIVNDLIVNEKYGRLEPQNVRKKNSVVLIPQWHLSPGQNTKNLRQNLPQAQNQLSIYGQLSDWVESQNIQIVIAEGCEGVIDQGMKTSFNGWSLADLQSLSDVDLDRSLTHVGMKLKAKFKDQLQVICGDDLSLIKKHQLVLSDIRGLFGFKIRIDQFKKDKVRRQAYLQNVKELLKLPKNLNEQETINALHSHLESKLNDFDDLTKKRNLSFTNTVKKADRRVAIVIGALHVKDLREQLQQQGYATQVFTPIGLDESGDQLTQRLKDMLKNE